MMGTFPKTESGVLVDKNDREELCINMLAFPLANVRESQEPIFFRQSLRNILERTSCISSSASMIMIVLFVQNKDELQPKKNIFQRVLQSMKLKSVTNFVKDAHFEYSVCEIGKTILLCLCFFEILKIFSSYDKLDYRKSETTILEPSIWKAVISETIYQILVSPGTDENHKMFRHSLFKLRLNCMDFLMSPEDSLKKLHTKGSNPKESEKGRIADSTNVIFVVLGWSGDSPTETIEIFDVTTQKWSFFHRESRFKRAYHGVALFGCKLYIVGGFDGSKCLSTTLCLNLKSRRWSKKSHMFVPRCYVCTLTYRGYVLTFGGHSGENRLKSCERYDPRRNKWIRISDMMYRRSDASGAQLNGRIFVCGGFDGFQFHFSAEMYDPEIDDWTLIGNLINPRSGHSMISYDGQLFVLGGFNGSERLRKVEKYNAETNQWEEYIPMLDGRSNFCCVIFEQEIYVIGGYNGITTINSVEVFNKKLMNWQPAPSLNVDRSAARACVMNNSANITSCALNDFVPVVSTDIEEPSP